MKKITKKLLLFLVLLIAVPVISLSAPTSAQAAATLSKPVLKNAKATSKGKVKLTWEKTAKSSGYLIYRDGKKIATVKGRNKLSYTDKTAEAGAHTYYIRAYRKTSSATSKSKKSNKKTVTVTDRDLVKDDGYDPSVNSSLYNVNAQTVDAQWAIEADLTISGSGTGYHGKMMINSATSAVSFGIQYDTACGLDAYRSQKAFMYENVGSNDPGQQSYGWIGLAEAKKTYHIMIAWKDCVCTFYVDGKKVGSAKNSNLSSPSSVVLEAACRKGGDSIKAVFSNVQAKIYGEFRTAQTLHAGQPAAGGVGMHAVTSYLNSIGKIKLYGTLSLASDKDWDSAYDKVQAYAQVY